jgi:hypothetical protein
LLEINCRLTSFTYIYFIKECVLYYLTVPLIVILLNVPIFNFQIHFGFIIFSQFPVTKD